MPALRQLTASVWLWPHDPDSENVQASVGIVAGETGSIVIDAGHGPALARQIRQAVHEAGIPTPQLLVYTHHHWDHTWGAGAWEVPAVAHELCTELLAAEAAKPWSQAYLHAEIARDPSLGPSYRARGRAVDDFDELRIVLPERTFTEELTVIAGGATVHLRHVGGGHTPESIVVTVPGDGVLFLGDCYYPPPFHLRQPGDEPDLDMVASLISDDIEWYVESHDVPRHRDDLPPDLLDK
ncbi:MBL fold metallo-hydrolase [Haloactinopolyspora sp.]|uniref:MBL fold metallo-hydrolase n=1 Tax=Haloactinopolyspora sp. TaxID=1966353 RepID=UPI00261A908D|nr:MBL fold metallo-hydrolase [Haloactinopolyspora sp.]